MKNRRKQMRGRILLLSVFASFWMAGCGNLLQESPTGQNSQWERGTGQDSLQAENSQCTFLLTTRDGNRGYVYSDISLIFKPGSALGEGIVFHYPCIRHDGVTYIPQVTADEKAMTLTYSYRFDEPLTGQYYSDSGLETQVVYAAGTYAHTVDLTTGAVTEEYIPLD